MSEGFESPNELPDQESLERTEETEKITTPDEGDFVVDESGFGSFEDALKRIREMGNGEVMDEAA